jgi:hypothetical protein
VPPQNSGEISYGTQKSYSGFYLSYKVGTHFGLDFEEAQDLTTYQLDRL